MKVIVQGLVVNYQDEGAGEIMLFLHGWQDDLNTFDSLIPFLSSYRIVRLDLPGFGESEAPKEAWDLNDYVRLVKDFIEKIGIRVDVAVGHSFGGRVVIKGAEVIGARKLILIGSAGVTKGALRSLLIKILTKIGGLVMYLPPFIFYREKIRRKLYSSIGSDYLEAGSLKGTFLKIVSEDLIESSRLIRIPTLLIWGVDDRETPLADGKRINDAIPGSRLEVIHGTGHFVHKERPDEVAKLIKEFI